MSSSSENAAKLRALSKLITNGVENLIAEYEKAGQDVPDLDSAVLGHLDTRDNVGGELTNAIKSITGACGQLAASVDTPAFALFNRASSFYDVSCLSVVLKTKVTDLLEGKTDGLPLDDLAKKSGIEKSKLGRVLRYLAAKHVFREVSPNVFANNRLSVNLLSANPLSALIAHMGDEILVASTKLADTLADPESGPSHSADHTAFRKAWGCNVFAFYHSDEGRQRGIRFNRAMTSTGSLNGAWQALQAFPWADMPKGTRICDVGGGKGHVMLNLLKTYPNLRVTIQDLPPVLNDAKEFWKTAMPEALENKRVDFADIDFLKESPSKDGDIYYMRYIIHDWPDEDAVKILSNVRRVMDPGNRLLIQEWIMKPLTRQAKPSQEEAPHPLLPNYGMGGLGPFTTDINMMNALNAKERSLSEFKDIGQRANFELVKLYGEDMGLMEFRAI